MKLILLICSLAITSFSFCQNPGDLDTAFGDNGLAVLDVSLRESFIAVKTLPNGKILATGGGGQGINTFDFIIARFNANGTIDNSFGNNGYTITAIGSAGDSPLAMALQSDGKILVAGQTFNGSNLDFALVRYNENGSIDTTFGNNGITVSDFFGDIDRSADIALQLDGKIVVSGTSRNGSFGITTARYSSDGMLDQSFGVNGFIFEIPGMGGEGRSVDVQPDGKIVVGGFGSFSGGPFEFVLFRYNIDGSLDNSFGTNGLVRTLISAGIGARLFDVELQNDGKILAVGDNKVAGTDNENIICRYNINGSLDANFGNNGITHINYDSGNDVAYFVLAQPDLKILVTGTSDNGLDYDITLARLNQDGTLDSGFGNNGKVITNLGGNEDYGYGISLASDLGILVAAGSSDVVGGTFGNSVIVKYHSGLHLGTINFEEFRGSSYVYPNPINLDTQLEYSLNDEQVLSVGLFDMSGRLVRMFFSKETRFSGNHTENLNFADIASGSYILKMNNGFNSFGIEVIKK